MVNVQVSTSFERPGHSLSIGIVHDQNTQLPSQIRSTLEQQRQFQSGKRYLESYVASACLNIGDSVIFSLTIGSSHASIASPSQLLKLKGGFTLSDRNGMEPV
eukprot:scaffold3697_cov390-Prasinococcus_capsulatus_cf.AAC.8